MSKSEKYTQIQVDRETRRRMEPIRRHRRWTIKTIVDEGVSRLLAEVERECEVVGVGGGGQADEAGRA